MKGSALALAFLAALAAPAAAQDGGKIAWTGKGQDPVTRAYEDALAAGRPIMFFFSAEGNKDCIELCNDAFSNQDVVEASAAITCIFVEIGKARNSGLASSLEITKVPAIVFADAQGTPLGAVMHREGPALAAAIRDLTNKATLRPNFPQDLDKALAAARKSGRPLFIYFFDDSPATVTMNRSLADPEIKPYRNRFEVAMAPLTRGNAVSAKYDVDRAPTLLILNPRLAKPEEKPIARITVARSPRELARDLQEALDAARAPVSEPSAPPSAVPVPVPPKEQLSDDEIDRKFIQARIAVATDLQKRGMKDKAIAVLEDLLQSYPKHVLTKDVRALLEQYRK